MLGPGDKFTFTRRPYFLLKAASRSEKPFLPPNVDALAIRVTSASFFPPATSGSRLSPTAEAAGAANARTFRHATMPAITRIIKTCLASCERRNDISTGVEGDEFILIRISNDADGIFPLPNRVDGIPNHFSHHDNALVGRCEMFGGSIGNKTLTLLSYAVLLVSVEPPPFVLNALVDSQCIFLETSGFQPGLDLLPVSIRVEVDPVSGCGCIVGRNTKAYHLTRLFTYASGGMAHMRRENEMRDPRFRNTVNPCGLSYSELGGFPLDLRPLHRHVRITGGMERDGMRAVR